MLETYFAGAHRTGESLLHLEIEAVLHNPIIDGLLTTLDGLVAVLDDNRQIVAINQELLSFAGLSCPEEALGLRPGEVFECVHAHETCAGCGTSRWCSTCGAGVAITASLATDRATDRLCAMRIQRDGAERDLFLSVRVCPLRIDEHRFLLLVMRDSTRDQERAALDRVFFHDINNILTGLSGNAEVLRLASAGEVGEIAGDVVALVRRLHQEMAIQQALTSVDTLGYTPRPEPTSAAAVLEDLQRIFARHAASRGLLLRYERPDGPLPLDVDVTLLVRVLSNMVTNACEASSPPDEVRVWSAARDGSVLFSVWNARPIPPQEQLRIFQRNFSTKAGRGRGLGTYSMKLLGETYLGGRVTFRSRPGEGTSFSIALPRSAAARPDAGSASPR